MTIKSFGRKFIHGVEHAGNALGNAAGKAAGGILGGAAGKSILSYVTSAAPEAAEAAPMLLLKTGGRIPGGRNKPVHFIGHGSEYILPANARPTKGQKKVVARNRKKANFVNC
jgi:hypothetical protein